MVELVTKEGASSRTRHFERATVLIKYAVLQLIVAVYLIGTKFMCADIFTKATDELTFKRNASSDSQFQRTCRDLCSSRGPLDQQCNADPPFFLTAGLPMRIDGVNFAAPYQPSPGVGGDVGFPIRFGWGFLYDTYPMYRACIMHVSCMYFDVSRSDTSRYIEIQQDTFVSVTLAIKENVSYLGICILLYEHYIPDTFKIHLDTMYLNPQTHKIHSP
jgi:hypothetical protein